MNRYLIKKLFTVIVLFYAVCIGADAQNMDAILEKMDRIKSELSPRHQYMFNELFHTTGIGLVNLEDVAIDYSVSASDKALFEKELNHYLSQLGVSYISLPDALEYEADEVELMGIFGVKILYADISIDQYCQDLERSVSPFTPADVSETDFENLNLIDLLGAAESMKGEDDPVYQWTYNKNGTKHWLKLEDKGSGYTLSLSGINSLEEYSAAPGGGAVSEPVRKNVAESGAGVGTSLGETYTIWVKTATHWYVNVRKGMQAVYLKLALKSNGDMNYSSGTGWYAKPSGSGFVQYQYTNGKWGAAKTVSSGDLEQALSKAEQEYIIVPSENMSKDKVRLNQKSAYFDDLDITLP